LCDRPKHTYDVTICWLFVVVIDNRLQVTLADLPFHQEATIDVIDWAALSDRDARRLRELGFDEGVAVEPLHGGLFRRDPVAVRIGRMTVAIRQAHAAAITVEPIQ
jgi:ferrous iron transport protein A